MKPRTTLHTKLQVLELFKAWGCAEPVPKKGKQVLVCWPGKAPLEADLAEIRHTELRSSYGDRLFEVRLSSKAEREFEETVQDAHVDAYADVQAQQLRLQRIAKYNEVTASTA